MNKTFFRWVLLLLLPSLLIDSSIAALLCVPPKRQAINASHIAHFSEEALSPPAEMAPLQSLAETNTLQATIRHRLGSIRYQRPRFYSYVAAFWLFSYMSPGFAQNADMNRARTDIQVLYSQIAKDHWLKPLDTSELELLIQQYLQGKSDYVLEIRTDLGDIVAGVLYSPKKFILNREMLHRLTTNERLTKIFHEFFHMLPYQERRSIVAEEYRKQIIAAPGSPENVSRVKRFLALRTQNEVEAYLWEFRYWQALAAHTHGHPTVKTLMYRYLEKFRKAGLLPTNFLLNSIVINPAGQEMVDEKMLRLQILHGQYATEGSNVLRTLNRYASEAGIDPTNIPYLNQWVLSWLSDPTLNDAASGAMKIVPQKEPLQRPPKGNNKTIRRSTMPGKQPRSTYGTLSPRSPSNRFKQTLLLRAA